MRTVTITKEYNVYKFNELSESAKESVKRWYLDGQTAEIFTEDCEQDLENLFGKNDLEVQYSLRCCQGDGFNIYGTINAENIIKCLDEHNGGCQLEKFENVLTDKEKKIILTYQKFCSDIELQSNRHYCYSLADYIDIVDDWNDQLEYYSLDFIDVKTIEKFENMVRGIFSELCNYYEDMGYKYFYEISEEDLKEFCEVNNYEFLSDGTLFN